MSVGAEALGDFLEALGEEGFDLAPTDHIRAERMLLALASTADAPRSMADLARRVGPLVCRSPAEQARFEAFVASRYHEQLAPVPPPPLTSPAPPRAPADTDPTTQAVRRVARTRRIVLVVAVALILAATFGLYRLVQSGDPAVIGTEDPQGVDTLGTEERPEVPAGRDGAVVVGELVARLQGADRYLVALIPFGLMLLAVWFRGRQDRMLERRFGPGSDESRVVELIGDPGRLFGGPLLRRSFRPLRLHRAVPSTRVDVVGSIRLTLRLGGFAALRHLDRPVAPEYLVISGPASAGAASVRIADDLVERMRREALHVAHYRLTRAGDAFVSVSADRSCAPTRLRDLASRYGDHRLLLLDDGRQLLDPLTHDLRPWAARLEHWRRRVMLTPVPEADFGRREELLAGSGLRVVSLASDPGLSGLARVLAGAEAATPDDVPASARTGENGPYPRSLARREARWVEPTPPTEQEQVRLLAELREHLDDAAFYWLQATAVFPKIIPAMTAHLGHHLEDGGGRSLQSLPRHLALSRLPWIRRGYMPDWLRGRLIDELSTAREQGVREVMLQLMCGAGPEAEEGGSARIPIEVIRRDTRAWTDYVLRLARRAPADSPLREQLFVDFLAPLGRRRLAVSVPGQLLGRLRRGLGADAWSLGGLTLACSALLYAVQPRLGSIGLGWITALEPVLRNRPVAVLLLGVAALSLVVVGRSVVAALRGGERTPGPLPRVAVALGVGSVLAGLLALVLLGVPTTPAAMPGAPGTPLFAVSLWAKVGVLAAFAAWLASTGRRLGPPPGWRPSPWDSLLATRPRAGPALRFAAAWMALSAAAAFAALELDASPLASAPYPFAILTTAELGGPERVALTPLVASPLMIMALVAAFRRPLGGWRAVARAGLGALVGVVAISIILALALELAKDPASVLDLVLALGESNGKSLAPRSEGVVASASAAAGLAGGGLAVAIRAGGTMATAWTLLVLLVGVPAIVALSSPDVGGAWTTTSLAAGYVLVCTLLIAGRRGVDVRRSGIVAVAVLTLLAGVAGADIVAGIVGTDPSLVVRHFSWSALSAGAIAVPWMVACRTAFPARQAITPPGEPDLEGLSARPTFGPRDGVRLRATWVDRLAWRTGNAVGYLLLLAAAILVLDVGRRFILAAPTDWSVEVAVSMCAVAVAFAGSYALQSRAHLTFGVQSLLPARLRGWLEIVNALLGVGYLGVLLYFVWGQAVESVTQQEVSVATAAMLPTPQVVKTALAAAVALMLLQLLASLFTRRRRGS